MKFLTYVLGVLILLSCKNQDKKNESGENLFLEIYYLREGMHFPMALDCSSLNSSLLSKEVKFKRISENAFMKSFKSEFTSLINEDYQKDIDSRIKILYHHSSIVDTICMGENFFIAVNGELKKDSPELLKLIKGKIYK